jgi:hypothetical protein
MLATAIRGKFFLERRNFTAEGKLASIQDALNGGIDLGLYAGVL